MNISVTDKKNRVKIMGSYIDALNMEESLKRIKEIILERKPVQHVVVNAAKIVMMNSNPKLRDIVNSCGMINADGQPVVWASKILGKPLPERVAGADLMLRIIKMAYKNDFSIYFFGARQEVVENVVEKFREQYPGLKVAGFRNGYFKPEENQKIIDNIRDSNADILFLGFSSPMKEYWLSENLEELKVPFCMGVGGAFDVAAGVTKRAPVWMQKNGLEWLYRFIQEPKRMWKRYLVGNTKFILLLFKKLIIRDENENIAVG
ncbi:MAG: WecB/TagA/CpsF family glycosyltransferase [Deltaproteobacteria bacterium]